MTLKSLDATRRTRSLDELRTLATSLPLKQRVQLLTGASLWRTHAAPHVGLRPVTLSDGPVGVRGTGDVEGETSVLLPAPSALAATWDTAAVRTAARAFAQEARAHGVDMILAPQVNIQRTPAGGRHFECYSEDPHLTSVITTHLVTELQSHGIAACVKHYVANDSETDRTTYVADVDEQSLREVYLAPFEAAVAAGTWGIMSAYNGVDDGVERAPMTEHHHLLVDVLKNELGFDGVVVSDWAATRTTDESAIGGLDLLMPGPDGPWGDDLLEAVRAGRVPESVVDDKVARLLLLAERVGALGEPRPAGDLADDLRAVARDLAVRGTVVLRAEPGHAPWERPAPARVALVGPNAVRPHVLGGGSSTVTPEHVVSPAEGLAARFPDANLVVERGGDPRRVVPRLDVATLTDGVHVTYLDAQGTPVRTETFTAWDGRIESLPHEIDAVEITCDVRLDEPGAHVLEVGTVAGHTVEIDGILVADSPDRAGVEVILDSTVNVPAGVPATVVVDEPRTVRIRSHHLVTRADGYGNLVRAELRHRAPVRSDDDEIAAAVAAAAEADLTVVVVGTNEEVESEGWDRTTLALPGRQDELVERVLDVAPDAVVVVNAGAPVLLPWLERARTVLWVWFPGQEAGHALADVLAGDAEATGRLPWTLPARESDVPVPHARPVDGVVTYDDGIHVGYRGWARSGAVPALPFGHGLGWTTWEHTDLAVREDAAGGLDVEVTVHNTGGRAGREVVQVFLDTPGDDTRPALWLGGFAAVDVDAGQHTRVHVTVPRRQTEVWDTATGSWNRPHGQLQVRTGRSARDLRTSTSVQI